MAPFPYLPMTAIMAGLVSQQVVQMSIFAYAAFMVEYLGAVDDKDEAGYYAGLLSSGFMIGRIFSSNFWGLVADRYGSRLVLISGLVATAILSIAFGFSKTFIFALVCRFLLGLFNGMMTASKTLVTEVCGTEHTTVGMGLITCEIVATKAAWSLGAVLGPGVGGMLALPADNFPSIFSQDGVFGRNPYLLSNVVGAGLSLVSLPLVVLFIKDTKGAGTGNPPEKAWYSSWCRFFRKGKGGGDNGGNPTDTRNDCGGAESPTSPTETDCAVSLEACGIRTPSWMQPGTMPPSTTDDKRASTGGKSRSAMEAFGIRKPSWMRSETIPSATDGKRVPTDEDINRKPSWMQLDAVLPGMDESRRESQRDAARRAARKAEDIKPESLLAQRHIVTLLSMEAVYSVSYSGFDEVYALWALSSASKGGLEWSSHQIGQVFFVCGLMVLLFELVAVPYLTPWLGVRLSQRLGSVFEVPVYFLFPFLSRMGGGDLPVTLTALVMLFTSYVCTNSFFVGTALAINTATSGDRRGELNGISSTISSTLKAASPVVSGALFAYSINSDHGFPINHHLAFAMLGSMRLIAACIGWNRITDVVNME